MSQIRVNRCGQIEAYFRREERYEGLQLVFKDHPELKEEIYKAIEESKAETKCSPEIYENCEKCGDEPYAIYIEFNDDYDKDGGEFFETVLRKLGIDKCKE